MNQKPHHAKTFVLSTVESPIDHMALKATTYSLLHPSLTCVLANEELRTTKLKTKRYYLGVKNYVCGLKENNR